MSNNTKFRGFVWTLGVLFGVCAAGTAFAQAAAPGPIKLDTAVYQDVQVKGPDGKVATKRPAPKNVTPGDEGIYEMTYPSSAKSAATNVVIDNPVPLLLEDPTVCHAESKHGQFQRQARGTQRELP